MNTYQPYILIEVVKLCTCNLYLTYLNKTLFITVNTLTTFRLYFSVSSSNDEV